MKNLYSYTPNQLKEQIPDCAHNAHEIIFSHLYKNFSPEKINDEIYLAKNVRQILAENFQAILPQISNLQTDVDGTTKFLFKFPDGKTVETVLVPFQKRYTVCISSQVGCAMNCSFCYTGTQGFERHLDVSEIIGQYIGAWTWLKQNMPEKSMQPNIVFMGQGEPLHNFDNVKHAIDIFTHPLCLNLGPRQITLSTVGYIPGIKRFHELKQINIALSLHSPFQEQRQAIMPMSKTFILDEVLKNLDQVPLKRKQFINFEYILLDGVNTSDEHAKGVAEIAKNRQAIVNLIPFNPFKDSEFKRPSDETVENFKNILASHRIPTMVRLTKGDNISAACGQLKSLVENPAC
jgi:23S rRNA (adenine2503-C2)-methyltransferase